MDYPIYLRYIPEYQILQCTKCRRAIPPDGIASYLRKLHRVKRYEARRLSELFQKQPLIPNRVKELIQPPAGCLSFPDLPVHTGAFACNHCDTVYNDMKTMMTHVRVKHNITKKNYPPGLEPPGFTSNVLCQTFFTGVGMSFFRVSEDGSSGPNTNEQEEEKRQEDDKQEDDTVELETIDLNDPIVQLLEERIEQIKARKDREKSIIRPSKARGEINPWLEKTMWMTAFKDKRLEDYLPLRRKADPAAEPILHTICCSLDSLVEKARDSILSDKINVFDKHRINSFISRKSNIRPINIDLHSATYKWYKQVWKQLLCYVFRTSITGEINTDYHLTQDQLNYLNVLVRMAEFVASTPEDVGGYELAYSDLEKVCLAFCISMLDHAIQGPIYQDVVVSFLGVLGIKPDSTGFRAPAEYTTFLSGFVKVAQLLVVQQSVLSAEENEVDYPSEKLEELHTRFMTFNCRSPFAWALMLRAFGKKLRIYATTQGKIRWSEDGEQVSLADEFECTMTAFRSFIKRQVEESHIELATLFLLARNQFRSELLPALRLVDIKDNPAEAKPGWYFIHDPRNQHLPKGEKWMRNRILGNPVLRNYFFDETKKRGHPWRIKPVKDYLASVSKFMERLARPFGTFVFMGIHLGNLELPFLPIMMQNLQIKGAFMYPREARQRLIGMIEAGLIDMAMFKILRTFSLDEVNEAIPFAKKNGGPLVAAVITFPNV
ncbi:hypothetical protein BZG36_05718 [Bifiguratus adelaidae]|uniref:C2H2-type domain-containing protein n=1 Tax=Bifiguratus adelaidae TaxID=1938954 RepID=A0A261XTQ7_9FUNG|nr:hypothetical protein BZG36_05718 [Bifiguratus adelaidae]